MTAPATLAEDTLPMPPRARERILRATLALIARRGVDAGTNLLVAAAADVSLGSLIYHFHSQAQLLRESMLRTSQRRPRCDAGAKWRDLRPSGMVAVRRSEQTAFKEGNREKRHFGAHLRW